MAEKYQAETKEHPPSPPTIPAFEWGSFFSTLLSTVFFVLVVSGAFFGFVRKAGIIKKVRKVIANQTKKKQEREKRIKERNQEDLDRLVAEIRYEAQADRALLLKKEDHEDGTYYSAVSEKIADRSIYPIKPFWQYLPKDFVEKNLGIAYKSHSMITTIHSHVNQKTIKVNDTEWELSDQWQNQLINAGVAVCYSVTLEFEMEVIGILSLHYSSSSRCKGAQIEDNIATIKQLCQYLTAYMKD